MMRCAAMLLAAAVCAAARGDDAAFWAIDAARDHGFTLDEAAAAAGMTPEEVRALLDAPGAPATARWYGGGGATVLPYPGGRHPRIGFLEGAIDPMRGTKASVFAPGVPQGFAVVDLPEAIFAGNDLLFLAHTHVPTIWDAQGIRIENVDWKRRSEGGLELERTLPNGIAFGSSIVPEADGASMTLWLRNGTPEPLRALRTQVCVMLKGLPGLAVQTNENKTLDAPLAEAAATGGSDLHVLTAWSRVGRAWGNPQCPCIHADPVFPDCAPGETVRAEGAIVFARAAGLDAARARLRARFPQR